MAYAEGTTVAAEKTVAEIRALLEKHGSTHYAHGSAPERDVVQFKIDGRQYRFDIARPTIDAMKEAYTGQKWGGRYYAINWTDRVAAEWRRRWRARLLWLKAQLEFAEDVPLEASMLSMLVLPSGTTFGEWAGPQVDAMYELGKMPPMLGDGR